MLERLKKDFKDPLFRNAYALLANALGTSLLGFLYWVLAARFYSPGLVGASSALIAALLLASTVAQLNLGGALARFLPRAGGESRRLVLSAYLVSGTLAILIALAAMPSLDRMAGDVGLKGSASHLWLGAAVAIWSIFALQDFTLTGLRKSLWVPAENAAFGALKIALLVVFASTAPSLGILASWTIPMALMLLPVNFFIFGKLLPRRTKNAFHTPRLRPKEVASFVALDYLGSLFSLASTQMLPVLIAARIGSEANGYFYIAWVVMTTLDFALLGVTSSLTVEGAHEEKRLPELVSALASRMVIAGGLLVVGLFIGAPAILSIFGPEYAEQSSGLLRLLAVGLLPRGVNALWISVARVQNRVPQIVAIQGAVSLMILGLSALLVPHFSILGVGIAYLIGQTAIALSLLPGLLRLIARPGKHKEPDFHNKSDLHEVRVMKTPTGPVSMNELSVVIPVRNAESLIEECLASVVKCGPAEIIVVDGLSTDSTLEIARRFPVRIISDEGLGLPVARTLGVAAARSRCVALVDADLVVKEETLESLLQEFVEGRYAGLQAGLRSVSGKRYWGRALANHHRFGLSRNWFGLAVTIFERERLLRLGFDLELASGEDIELRLRLRDLGVRLGVSHQTVAVHRFEDDYTDAKRQWSADGSGLARVVRKRGLRSSWLVGLPLVSAVWGVVLSLLRLQPHWIPYFVAYLVGNYASMLREFCRSAERSHIANASFSVLQTQVARRGNWNGLDHSQFATDPEDACRDRSD